MGKETNDGKFSCMECGEPFEVFPPDSNYKNASLDPCTEGCNKPMKKICQSCHHITTIYWCSGHIHIVSAGPNLDEELDRSYPF